MVRGSEKSRYARHGDTRILEHSLKEAQVKVVYIWKKKKNGAGSGEKSGSHYKREQTTGKSKELAT